MRWYYAQTSRCRLQTESPDHVSFVLHFHFRFWEQCSVECLANYYRTEFVGAKPLTALHNCFVQSESSDFLFAILLFVLFSVEAIECLIEKCMLAGALS